MDKQPFSHEASQNPDHEGAIKRYRQTAELLRERAAAFRKRTHTVLDGVAIRTDADLRLGILESDQHIGPEQLERAADEFDRRADALACSIGSAAAGNVVQIPSQRTGE